MVDSKTFYWFLSGFSSVGMNSSSSSSSDDWNDLLVEIVETLETRGLESETFQLQEYVDVDALEKLMTSSDGEVTVQFTVEGIRLEVSPESVSVVGDKATGSTN